MIYTRRSSTFLTLVGLLIFMIILMALGYAIILAAFPSSTQTQRLGMGIALAGGGLVALMISVSARSSVSSA